MNTGVRSFFFYYQSCSLYCLQGYTGHLMDRIPFQQLQLINPTTLLEKLSLFRTGWQPGEIIDMVIIHQIYTNHPNEFVMAVADENGAFVNSEYYIDATDLGIIFPPGGYRDHK